MPRGIAGVLIAECRPFYTLVFAFLFTKDLIECARTDDMARFRFPIRNRRRGNTELVRQLIAAEAEANAPFANLRTRHACERCKTRALSSNARPITAATMPNVNERGQ